MKKIFLLLALAFSFHASVFAQGPFGAMKVMLSDNTPLTVAVDGRYFQKHGTSLTVGDLPPGKHRLKVFAYSANGYTELLYKGKVFTSERMTTYVTIDPNTRMANFSDGPMENRNYPPPTRQDGYNNAPPPNDNYNNNQEGNNNMQNEQPAYNDNTNTSTAPAASPVSSYSQASMDKLKTTIAKKITDTDKIKALKSSLQSESITTEQVGAMMDWLNFESSKVEFAKWAYTITADPENYKTLENKFTYQSSQDELENFMNGK